MILNTKMLEKHSTIRLVTRVNTCHRPFSFVINTLKYEGDYLN
jgi:hypothetical protein